MNFFEFQFILIDLHSNYNSASCFLPQMQKLNCNFKDILNSFLNFVCLVNLLLPWIRRLTNKHILYSSASIPFNRNNLVVDVLGFVALEF